MIKLVVRLEWQVEQKVSLNVYTKGRGGLEGGGDPLRESRRSRRDGGGGGGTRDSHRRRSVSQRHLAELLAAAEAEECREAHQNQVLAHKHVNTN